MQLTRNHACLALTTFVMLAARCSSSPSNGDGGTDSGNNNDSSPGDGGPGNDGSPNKDGSPESGPPAEPYGGSVILSASQVSVLGTTNTTLTGSAAFYAIPDGGLASGCQGTTSGSCCYTPPSVTSPTLTPESAGSITVKDGSTTIATLNPTGTTYTPATNPPTASFTFAAGDTINVSAAGNTVDTFSGSVTAVALLVGLNPTLSETTPTAVSRSQDFVMSWTAGTGTISLTLSATKGTSADGSIVCSAADSGSMTVPHSLLQSFSAGDTGSISLARSASSTASAANANVTIESTTSFSGTATYN